MPTRTLSVPRGPLWAGLRVWWQRVAGLGRRAPRRLRLTESLPLGERRFVAVIEFDQERFLLGGTSSSLVLLARLGDPPGPGGGLAGAARPSAGGLN